MAIFELPKPLAFAWDDGNINKNLIKHNVSDQECEEVFNTEQIIYAEDFLHSQTEPRYIVIGPTKAYRLLYVAFTIRHNRVRVISARDPSKKERKFYEKTIETA